MLVIQKYYRTYSLGLIPFFLFSFSGVQDRMLEHEVQVESWDMGFRHWVLYINYFGIFYVIVVIMFN